MYVTLLLVSTGLPTCNLHKKAPEQAYNRKPESESWDGLSQNAGRRRSHHSHGLPPFTFFALYHHLVARVHDNVLQLQQCTTRRPHRRRDENHGGYTRRPQYYEPILLLWSRRVPVEVTRPGVFYAVTPATFSTKWTKNETPIITG